MHLIFLDFATTGIDPVHDQPIEIAAARVDARLNPVDGFSAVINPPHVIDRAKLAPIVQDMHARSGLWADLDAGRCHTLRSVHAAFDAWLGDAAPGMLTLAGDSVHFDLQFLKHWFPAPTVAKFGHRLLDLSAFRVAREFIGLPDVYIKGTHRAQSDVLASIAKARWHISRLQG